MNRPDFQGGSFDWEWSRHENVTEVFPEVVERAVRMVLDAKDQYPSQWAAIESIAGKIGCTAETLRRWVRQGERDSGTREDFKPPSSRSPHRATGARRPEAVSRRCARPGSSARPRCCLRSNGCGRATCGSTAPTRSGSNCAASTWARPAARSSG